MDPRNLRHWRLGSRLPGCAALLIALCLSRPSYALDPGRTLSQYVHRIWQVQQGLPQASIYAIVQTHDGYVWLGTQTALVKFDGVRFTTIEQIDGVSLANVWVTELVEDEQGSLWIGTNHAGLLRVRNGKITRFSTHEGLPSDTVQCLFNDRRNNIWACTPQGLAEITREKIRVFGAEQGLTNRDVQAACVMPNGTLHVGSGAQIAAWDGSDFQERRVDGPGASSIGALLCAADNMLWVGTNAGLLRMHGEEQERFTRADGLADDDVLTLTAGRDGSVFVGTQRGFSRVRGREIESVRPEDGLSQSTVYSLYEDREGSLWAATKHGLNQFFDGRAIPYTTREGLPSNDTGPVFQDSHGRIWIGTLGGGLARFDHRHFASLTTDDGLASNTIRALAEDGAGALLIGTDAGLNRLRDGAIVDTWTTARGLPGNRVQALYRDGKGAIWIATSGGVAVLRDGVLDVPSQFDGRRAGSILAFGEDRGGVVRAVPAPDPPSLHAADALFRDSEGSLWVGTVGEGLRLIDKDRIISFSVLDGLFDDVIYGIAEDDEGRLWMACSKGIFSVSRADLRAFAAGEIRSFVSTPYSPLDGLRTIECQAGVQPAVMRMSDGRLWFSTIRGVLVLDPKNLERRSVIPTVAIEDVIVDGGRARSTDIGELVAGRNNVEFGYTGVTFIAPTRVTFRYMLEGFNTGWVDAGTRRQAFYSNLPPGRFRFRVTACSPDGGCSEAPHPVAFTIEPRLYQRTWFFPACGVALALGAWTIYQLRIRRLREEFDIILAERGRIARELHDTLIQGFSGITMAMQALVSHLPVSEIRRELEDIVADAGSSLREARRSLAGLRRHDSHSGLAAAVAGAARQLTEAKDVRLKLDLAESDRPLPPDVEYNLLRISQEAVSNAVKHSGARTLQVTLVRTPQHLRLSVRDDGSGFDETGAPPVGHYGLLGMKERAAQIGADFRLTTARGRGTLVQVEVAV